MEQLQSNIIKQVENTIKNEQVEKNIELFKDVENPNYKEFIEDIDILKNKWINKIKNDRLDKIKIKTSYIRDNYWDWQFIIDDIRENNKKIMILCKDYNVNEFINLDTIENCIWAYEDFIDENGNLIEDDEFITWAGCYEGLEEYVEDLEYYIENENITLERLKKAYNTLKNVNWNKTLYEEKMIEAYNQLTGENLELYESRGYSQGDYVQMIYDKKTVNLEYLKYIDGVLWGKGYDLEIIEGANKHYITFYKEFASDEDIKEFVSEEIGYSLEELEVVED